MSLLDNYRAELEYAHDLKNIYKVDFVMACTAGEKLAAGRESIPIDEYIQHWQNGVTALENGADEADFNY